MAWRTSKRRRHAAEMISRIRFDEFSRGVPPTTREGRHRLPPETVDAYCARILQRPHLTSLNAAARAMLERKYRAYMELFRNNLSLMGYTVMMLRKSSFIEDEELFVGERAS
ncbi:hypothetical protein P7L78_01130 (plasmid) [Tistrella bauzanensis]|uniref:hypothetical protein n=1 Tax=Tistrella TaxID=171436 RepID=UPI0031F6EB62